MSAPASRERTAPEPDRLETIGPDSLLWVVLSPDVAFKPRPAYSSNLNTSSSGAPNTRAMRKAASRLGE